MRMQDGKTSVSKMAGWLAAKVGAKETKADEFEHVREYLVQTVSRGSEHVREYLP